MAPQHVEAAVHSNPSGGAASTFIFLTGAAVGGAALWAATSYLDSNALHSLSSEVALHPPAHTVTVQSPGSGSGLQRVEEQACTRELADASAVLPSISADYVSVQLAQYFSDKAPRCANVLLIGPHGSGKLSAVRMAASQNGGRKIVYLSGSEAQVEESLTKYLSKAVGLADGPGSDVSLHSTLEQATELLRASVAAGGEAVRPVFVVDDVDVLLKECGAGSDAHTILQWLAAISKTRRLAHVVLTASDGGVVRELNGDLSRSLQVVPVGFLSTERAEQYTREAAAAAALSLEESDVHSIVQHVGGSMSALDAVCLAMQSRLGASEAIAAHLHAKKNHLRDALLNDREGLLLWTVLQEFAGKHTVQDSSGLKYISFERVAESDKFKKQLAALHKGGAKANPRVALRDVLAKYQDVLFDHSLGHPEMGRIGEQHLVSSADGAMQSVVLDACNSDDVKRAMYDRERQR